jgi:hypothetical protein
VLDYEDRLRFAGGSRSRLLANLFGTKRTAFIRAGFAFLRQSGRFSFLRTILDLLEEDAIFVFLTNPAGPNWIQHNPATAGRKEFPGGQARTLLDLGSEPIRQRLTSLA